MEYDEFINGWFERVRAYQLSKGRQFELTAAQFAGIITPHQQKTIKKHLAAGTIDGFMRHREFGYVLSWVSKQACIEGVMNLDTARVMIRRSSEKMNGLRLGDKHSENAKVKISAKLKGRRQDKAHVEARADAMRGQKRPPRSEDTKAQIRATMLARAEARRATAAGSRPDQSAATRPSRAARSPQGDERQSWS